jgi:hypothetical protein
MGKKMTVTREDFDMDLMPPELVLKLIRDFSPQNYEGKLSLVRDHFEKLKSSNLYHPSVLALKEEEQTAFIYWDAGQLDKSVFHYERILNSSIVEHAPNSYSMAAFMTIRCYRLIKNYAASMHWSEHVLSRPEILSNFSKLDVLSEYVDLLTETSSEFNKNHVPIILEIITELGFPVVYKDNPVESILTIKEMNRKWNLKIPTIRLTDEGKKENWESYILECEVGWYKKYAKQRLDEINNECLGGV